MEQSFLKQMSGFLRDKKNRKRYIAVFLCLALVVSLTTFVSLTMSGNAQNHMVKVLDCKYEAHKHTADCYDKEHPDQLICGYADYAVHIHNDDCYDASGVLVCQLPQIEPHTHDETCYTEEKTLTCELPESEGHVHTEACYTTEQGELTCTVEEHTHSEECYDENGEVICGKEEHTHNEACYEQIQTLTCEIPEGEGAHTHTDDCYVTEKKLTCGKLELHTHTEECYQHDENGKLVLANDAELVLDDEGNPVFDEEHQPIVICGIPVLEEHVHGADCFKTVELTDEEVDGFDTPETSEAPAESESCYDAEGNLICTKEEHTHTEECYDEAAAEIVCGKEEHTHTAPAPAEAESCYDAEGNLICTKEEHTHTEECYGEDGALTCEKDEHTHTAPAPAEAESCYDAEGNLICTKEEHTHSEECYGEDGTLTCEKEEHTHTGAGESNEPEELTKTYQDSGVVITATYTEAANIPEEAELIAKAVTSETDPELYAQRMEEALQHVTLPEDAETPNMLLYNIGFYVDGEEVEPAAPVTITVQLLNAEGFAVGAPITVVHFADDGTEVLDGTALNENSETTFTTDGFSPFALLSTTGNEFGIMPINARSQTIESEDDFVNFMTNQNNWYGKTPASLGNDLTITQAVTVKNERTLDLNGKTLTLDMNNAKPIDIQNGGNLTINNTNGSDKSTAPEEEAKGKIETKQFAYGALFVSDGGKLTINGGTITNPQGFHGIEINGDGASVEMNGGCITGCGKIYSTTGGGVAVNSDKASFTMQGGIICDNHASDGGGVYVHSNSAFTMTGGKICTNDANQGGGVYIEPQGGTFTMESGTICHNTSWDVGGGIACRGVAYIYGGNIEYNVAEDGEGGGIAVLPDLAYWGQIPEVEKHGGLLVIDPTKSGTQEGVKISIKNNKTTTDGRWGGGGIFVAQYANAILINGVITQNTAQGFGGGVTACTTGNVFVGNGQCAIDGNEAYGNNLANKSEKNSDVVASKDPVFMQNGYQDVFIGKHGSMSGKMMGEGSEEWKGSADGAPVQVGGDQFASCSEYMGLTSEATDNDWQNALAVAEKQGGVYIEGNASNTHGGGILCNGTLLTFFDNEIELHTGLELDAKKMFKFGEDEVNQNVWSFKFALSDTKPEWNEATQTWVLDEGNVIYKQNGTVFGDGTNVKPSDGSFNFNLTFNEVDGPYLTKDGLTKTDQNQVVYQTFYFWEVKGDEDELMKYDTTLYKIVVPTKLYYQTGARPFITQYPYVKENSDSRPEIDISEYYVVHEGIEVFKWDRATNSAETWQNVDIAIAEGSHASGGEIVGYTGHRQQIVTLKDNAFTNTWKGGDVSKVAIRKVDDQGKAVGGAVFKLEHWDGTEWKRVDGSSITTGNDGWIYQDGEGQGQGGGNKLLGGTYRLTEKEAPEGYWSLPKAVEFTITENKIDDKLLRSIHYTSNGGASDYVQVKVEKIDGNDVMVLSITNTPVVGSVRVEKLGLGIDGETSKPLKDAKFTLYAEDNTTALWKGTSDDDGKVTWEYEGSTRKVGDFKGGKLILPYGTYYLKETMAPAGYNLVTDFVEIKVEIDTSTNTAKVTGTIKNSEGSTDRQFVKIKDGDADVNLAIIYSDPMQTYTLPETGGGSTHMYMLGGAMLLLLAAALAYKAKISGRRVFRG